jgi:ABC-type nitrate/sulfonate/bicarbonate transport system, permease component
VAGRGVSLYRIIVGFLIASVMAIPIGVVIGSYRFWEAAIEPLTDFIRYMPVVAFVPLTILWSGTGDGQKFLIIWIGTFFQQVLLIQDNVKRVPGDFIGLGRTLGLSDLKILMKIVVPSAFPGIWDTLRISLGWAWTWVVVAELGSGHLRPRLSHHRLPALFPDRHHHRLHPVPGRARPHHRSADEGGERLLFRYNLRHGT